MNNNDLRYFIRENSFLIINFIPHGLFSERFQDSGYCSCTAPIYRIDNIINKAIGFVSNLSNFSLPTSSPRFPKILYIT